MTGIGTGVKAIGAGGTGIHDSTLTWLRTYKCPCGGEFNNPVVRPNGSFCPFCGKQMEGLE